MPTTAATLQLTTSTTATIHQNVHILNFFFIENICCRGYRFPWMLMLTVDCWSRSQKNVLAFILSLQMNEWTTHRHRGTAELNYYWTYRHGQCWAECRTSGDRWYCGRQTMLLIAFTNDVHIFRLPHKKCLRSFCCIATRMKRASKQKRKKPKMIDGFGEKFLNCSIFNQLLGEINDYTLVLNSEWCS